MCYNPDICCEYFWCTYTHTYVHKYRYLYIVMCVLMKGNWKLDAFSLCPYLYCSGEGFKDTYSVPELSLVLG